MDWQNNPRLKSLAYGMLGSVADAEDVLQDAVLKLHQTDPPPEVPEAFLYRVVSNLCIDRLRAERVRRKHYEGPWLPDPYPVDDTLELASLAEQLTTGFLLLLENLSPAERVVYVLREGFDFSFSEIASLLDISAANARQRATRARARLREISEPNPAPKSAQKAVLEDLVMRIAADDVAGVVALLKEDAVVLTDGGGVVSAAIRPITGRARIAQVLTFLGRKAAGEGGVEFEWLDVPVGIALLMRQHGAPHSCYQIEVADGRVQRLFVMRNPHKLAHLAAVTGKVATRTLAF